MVKLSDKRERFVQEYMVDFNGTAAAIRAGYSPRSAAQQASELLKNPKVRARIEELMAEMSRRTGVTAERIERELARIAFVKPTDVIDPMTGTVLDDASKDDVAAIMSVKAKEFSSEDGGGIEREVRFHDKIKALELLGKRRAMWVDKQAVDLTAKVEIVDDIPAPQDEKAES